MSKPHRHDESCEGPPLCRREWDVSGDTPTGFFKLVALKKDRKSLRKHESLTSWVIWHFWQAASKGFGQAFGLLTLVLVAILAKHCGVSIPGAP